MFAEMQVNFQIKLLGIRTKQLEKIRKRHEWMRAEWQARMAEWAGWKRTCEFATCKGCGFATIHCACKSPVTLEQLVEMLRLKAKINPHHGLPECVHDEDKSSGPVGYRVCGKDSWDNVTRAHEENR